MLESAVGVQICTALAALDGNSYPADIFPSDKFYIQDLSSPEIRVWTRVQEDGTNLTVASWVTDTTACFGSIPWGGGRGCYMRVCQPIKSMAFNFVLILMPQGLRCRVADQVSTRILGRRTAPFPAFLVPNRVPHGFTQDPVLTARV